MKKPLLLLSIAFSSLFCYSSAFAYQEGLRAIPVTAEEEARLLILPAPISTPYSEYNPSILTDGSLLFFESDRPGGQGLNGDFDIWFSRLQNSNKNFQLPPTFSQPENLPSLVNTAFFEGQPFVRKNANQELELYFTSFAQKDNSAGALREGSQQTNIYVTRLSKGQWTKPEPLFAINSDFNDRMASLSADGKLLFFSSDRPGGYGEDDIWYSFYNDATQRWQTPRNAGEAVNGSESEISPSLHQDGVTLYFSSNRIDGVGGYDLYVTQFEKGSDDELIFRPMQNMGRPYNSPWDDEHPSVSGDGQYMYFSSNRENGYGLFDIYQAAVPDFAKPEILIDFAAVVREKGTQKGLEANIELQGWEGTRRISSGLPQGNFSFQLKNKHLYKILITAPGFIPLYEVIDLRDIHTKQPLQKTYELERIKTLPSEFHLYVHFENEKGERLLPKASYLVSPTMKTPKEFTAEHFFQIEGKTANKSNKQVLNFIKKFDIIITASLAGYRDIKQGISLYDILFLNNDFPQSENHIVITMRPLSAASAEQMPNTKDALAIFYFDNGVYQNVSDHKGDSLDELALYLKNNPAVRIYIDGHTDKRGSKELNATLSQDRARYIFSELKKRDVSESRMFLRWFDYSQPAVAESNDKGEKLNRRAEVHVIKTN